MSENTNPWLPDSEWLDPLLDRKLLEMADDLADDGKISATDFEKLIRYQRANFPVRKDLKEIHWADAARNPCIDPAA